MPNTCVIATVCCISMAGLPPLGGFISKELFYESALGLPDWLGLLLPYLAVAAGILTFAYTFKFLFHAFWGPQPKSFPHAHPHEAKAGMLLPPLLLTSIALALGLFPGLLSSWLLESPIGAVTAHYTHLHLALWHGLNVPILMSGVTVVVGILLAFHLRSVNKLQNTASLVFQGWTPETVYNELVYNTSRWMKNVYTKVQSGQVKQYICAFLLFLSLSLSYWAWKGMWRMPSVTFDPNSISFTGWFVLGFIALTSLLVVLAKSRITAVIALGLTGYLITFLYAMLGAPDLALTQALIETVSTILILLVFFYLPPYFEEKTKTRTRLFDAGIAIFSGIVITITMFTVMNSHLLDSIASFYLENSYLQAHGRNVVNVIIVDFRGFDTLGEISVLVIATIGILALLKYRFSGSLVSSKK